MTAKYTGSLTPDQLATVRAAQDEWMRNALSTERADRPAAEAAVRSAYRTAGLSEPSLIIWMDSPLGGAFAAAVTKQLPQLRDQLWGQLWDQLGLELSSWWDGYWLCLYANALPIAGLDVPERLTALTDAVQSCGWWWPQNGAVILTDRATDIRRDAQNRLHAEHGPALGYGDGYVMYSWHGRTLPADPDEIRTRGAQRILEERNAETRRAMIEIIGWDSLTSQLHLVAECDDPGNPGEKLALYDLPRTMRDLYEAPARILLCTNGTVERDNTRRRFGLPVPAQHSDPISAAADLYGWPREAYARLEVRR